jgi:hypothetical protein
MALSQDTLNRLCIALGSATAGNELATALNKADALRSQTGKVLVATIVATNVSQTVDFGVLAVNDLVCMIPATPGNADLITISTAGTLGQAAVVGNIYQVFRDASYTGQTAAFVF